MQPASKKRKSSAVLSTSTVRAVPFAYFHLTLVSPHNISDPLDDITVRTYLTSALNQFLGITGTAIPIDILKVDGRDVWIRAPAEDSKAVTEAVSGWIGSDVTWRICGSGSWLGGVVYGSGRQAFES